MLDPGVNDTDTSAVHNHNRIAAVLRHVVDELVTKVMSKTCAVEAFRCVGIDENKTGLGVGVYSRVDTEEVPTKSTTICDDAVLDRFKGADHIGWCARTGTTCCDQRAV